MMWFSARIVMKSIHDGAPDPSILQDMSEEELDEQTFEESIFLVEAPDGDSALEEATRIASGKEHSYTNKYGQVVRWELVGVLEIKEILADAIGHGTEVYYRFFTRHKTDTTPIE